jgi:ABC-type antimicrobial peptide transport system permease subunit
MFSDPIHRLRSLFRSTAAESELDEELAFHLEHETEKLIRSGLPRGEARRRARLAIGGPAQIKEDVRDEWIWRWCRDLAQDTRYAFRALRQSSTFTAVAVLSLALGIGANTAIFSILNAVIMKPLPVREPSRLVHFFHGTTDDSFTYAIWEQIRDRQDVFSSALAYSANDFDLADGGERRPAKGVYVSGDYFRTLGVPAALGRVLTVNDDRRGAPPVAVIGYGFWQRASGGDSHIAGRTIRLDGHPFEIVGVTPRSFFGMDIGNTFDVMVPLSSEALIHAERPSIDERSNWWLSIIGRLKPGVSFAQAASRFAGLSPVIYQAAMDGNMPHEFQENFLKNTLDLKPAAGLSYLRYEYGGSLVVLMGIAGLVLLIACVNIANLLLARATARQREIAIRLAVGAGRGRIIRQLLTESVVLSLMGAACGAVLARWAGPAVVALISVQGQSPFLDLSPDIRVLAFTTGAAILTGILFGFAPTSPESHSQYHVGGAEAERPHPHGAAPGLVVGPHSGGGAGGSFIAPTGGRGSLREHLTQLVAPGSGIPKRGCFVGQSRFAPRSLLTRTPGARGRRIAYAHARHSGRSGRHARRRHADRRRLLAMGYQGGRRGRGQKGYPRVLQSDRAGIFRDFADAAAAGQGFRRRRYQTLAACRHPQRDGGAAIFPGRGSRGQNLSRRHF